MATAEQFEAIKRHITERFELLSKMLSHNGEYRVIFPGISATNHYLGTGLARVQWSNSVQSSAIVSQISGLIAKLGVKFPGRITYGNVGDVGKTVGTQFIVSPDKAASKNLIHVWGANADNWNLGDGGDITGGGQAAVMGKQRPGVFGIVTTPTSFDQQKLIAEWAYDENWNPKQKAATSPAAPAVNTKYWYEDGGGVGKLDLVNTISAYALEAGFVAVDESTQCLYKKGNKFVGILPAAASPQAAFFLGADNALKQMIEKMKNGHEAQIFLPVNVGGKHWTMLEMNFEKKGGSVSLSSANFYDSAETEVDLMVLRDSLSKIITGAVEIKQPPCAKQQDGSSCGPIACWYAGQRIKGLGVGGKFPEGAEELRKHQAKIVSEHFPGYVIGGSSNLTARPPKEPRPRDTNRSRDRRFAQVVNGQQPKSASKKRTLSDFKIDVQGGVILTVSDQQGKEITEKLEKDQTWKVEDGRVQTTDEYKRQWMSYYANTTRHADLEAIKNKIGAAGIDSSIKKPSPNLIKVLSVVVLQAKKEREEKEK